MPLKTWRRVVAGSGYSRAERHLRSAQIELDAARAGQETAAWATTATALLAEAATALQARKVEHCWHLVNGARRQIASAKDDAERAIAARLLLIEATKLSPWRRQGIEAVLKDGVAPAPAVLREALWLRDDYYENRYHRIDMQREQLRTIVVVGAIALFSGVAISATSPTPVHRLLPDAPWHWRVLAIVLAFGVLGASFSAARTITVKDLRTIIPELVLSKWITWARTLLGASLGLAAYTFLQSGLLNVGTISLATAAAIAFVGGFSEQVILKVIGTFGEREAKPAK